MAWMITYEVLLTTLSIRCGCLYSSNFEVQKLNCNQYGRRVSNFWSSSVCISVLSYITSLAARHNSSTILYTLEHDLTPCHELLWISSPSFRFETLTASAEFWPLTNDFEHFTKLKIMGTDFMKYQECFSFKIISHNAYSLSHPSMAYALWIFYGKTK